MAPANVGPSPRRPGCWPGRRAKGCGSQPTPPLRVSPFITEVSGPAGTVPPPGKTMQSPQPSLAQAAATVGLARDLLAKSARGGKSTPEEIIAQITGLKAVIISGVNSAGYGDKRTEFRSLTELRQILGALEEELDDLLGRGGRIRQIRMTTQADKGL